MADCELPVRRHKEKHGQTIEHHVPCIRPANHNGRCVGDLVIAKDHNCALAGCPQPVPSPTVTFAHRSSSSSPTG